MIAPYFLMNDHVLYKQLRFCSIATSQLITFDSIIIQLKLWCMNNANSKKNQFVVEFEAYNRIKLKELFFIHTSSTPSNIVSLLEETNLEMIL